MFTIRAKAMILAFTVVCTVGLSVIGYSLVRVQKIYLEETLAKGSLTSDILSYSIIDSLYNFKIDKLSQSLSNALINKDVTRILISDNEFYILSDGTENNDLRDELLVDVLGDYYLEAKSNGHAINKNKDRVLFFRTVYITETEIVGYALVEISLEAMQISLHKLQTIYMAIAGGVLIMALLLSAVASSLITRPINNLIDITKRLAKGDFSARAKHTTTDEVGKLSRSIDYMAAQLETTTVSKDYVSNVVDAMSDGLFVLGLNDKVVQINQTFIDMAELTEQDVDNIIGQPIDNHFDGEHISVIYGTQPQERNIIRENSDNIAVRIKPSPMLDDDGNLIAYVYIIINMVDEVERSRLLVDAKKNAEEMLAAKAAFMSKVSHELRTPLNAIMGFTQRVIKSPEDQLSKRNKGGLEQVMASSQVLLGLIENMLDLNKSASDDDIRLQTTDLQLVLRADYDRLKLEAESQSLTTEFIAPKGFIGILTDVKIINDVISRLFDNALKFTEHGSITLRLELSEDEKNAIISVEDTGIGILEENLTKVFMEFTHLQENVAGKESGAGVGLSIARRQVERLQGSIRAESTWGKGSRFIVTLPRRRAAEVLDS